MADIDVVPKRRSNWIVWLIAALILVGLLWLMFGRSSEPSTREGRSGALLSTPPSAVSTAPTSA